MRPNVNWGDLVLIYEGYGRTIPQVMKQDSQYKNRYGVFPHTSFVGRAFGSKVGSVDDPSKWVILLRPTSELWTVSLRHRTQILYIADISLVIARLGVRPGSVVMEAGTGSGSLSTAFARALAPSGHLHTFEFNEQRQLAAVAEFKANGLDSVVTCRFRDVVRNGLPALDGGADSIFLDLPTPWDVVESARRNLRPNGRFCSFSPCIEQVQRTCATLRKSKFRDIRTFEVLLRNYDVSFATYRIPEPPPFKPKKARAGKKRKNPAGVAAAGAPKRARAGGEDAGSTAVGGGGARDAPLVETTGQPAPVADAKAGTSNSASQTATLDREALLNSAPPPDVPEDVLSYIQTQKSTMVINPKRFGVMGHTGYLTFALNA